MDACNISEIVEQRNPPDARNAVVVAVIPKNKGEDLVISLCQFNGHDLLDIRVHSLFNGATEKRPTRKGVSINIGRLPELTVALHQAADQARRLGLLSDAPEALAGPKDRTAAERQRRRRDRLRLSRDVTHGSVTVTDDARSLFHHEGGLTPNN